MGYVSDWIDAEEQARRAYEANPDCTQQLDCPADDEHHLVLCAANRQRIARKEGFDSWMDMMRAYWTRERP